MNIWEFRKHVRHNRRILSPRPGYSPESAFIYCPLGAAMKLEGTRVLELRK